MSFFQVFQICLAGFLFKIIKIFGFRKKGGAFQHRINQVVFVLHHIGEISFCVRFFQYGAFDVVFKNVGVGMVEIDVVEGGGE